MQSLARARSGSASARPIGDADRFCRRAPWSGRALPTTPTPTTRAATAAAAPNHHNHRPRRVVTASCSDGPTTTTTTTTTPSSDLFTCRRCLKRVSATGNHAAACRYHPSLYSGGEVAKAIGFVRASANPEDQLEKVIGRKGLMRFWDCCGNEDADAVGCEAGFHVTFDDEDNARRGWK